MNLKRLWLLCVLFQLHYSRSKLAGFHPAEPAEAPLLLFVRGGGGDVEVSQVAGVRSLFWFALLSRLEQGASKIRWSGFFDSTF